MSKNLSRSELEDLHSVLRRAAERLERRRRMTGTEQPDPEADALAAAVADLNDELARVG
jgi:hypothetical protein